MIVKKGLVLLAVLFLVSITFVTARTLTNKPEGGYPVSEGCDINYGGIQVCSYCYDCGADDGVCPLFVIEKILNYSIESYKIKEDPIYIKCSKNYDPDCLVYGYQFVK